MKRLTEAQKKIVKRDRVLTELEEVLTSLPISEAERFMACIERKGNEVLKEKVRLWNEEEKRPWEALR